MDSQFLEFWGNFLVQAAKGQRQIEDLAKWMKQGFQGAGDLTDMFKKAYGLDGAKTSAPDHQELWNRASGDFIRSFQDWLGLMGMVTQTEHQTLAEKYETLKKKADSQEETIRHLQKLLKDKGHSTADEVKNFQDLMQKQADEFQLLMEGIGHAFKKKGE